MRLLRLALVVLLLAPAVRAQSALEASLQSLVDSVAADPGMPGALLAVDAPRLGLQAAWAAGVADLESGETMETRHRVRIASNTKTYVAAAALRLWEIGQLDLDAPLTAYLDTTFTGPLERDGYDVGAITVRHLVTHTGGLVDHAQTQNYFAEIMADPQRTWTPLDQVRGAAAWGDPLGPPEVAFAYSDTGYILLGQVVEAITGEALGAAVRRLVSFEANGLEATHWELTEPDPPGAGPRAHQYLGPQSTHAWNPSLDLHGGGGLVASVGDLALFWRSLFAGGVFDRAATLDTMLTSPVEPSGTDYRMGIFVRDFDGMTAYEHSGFWGTQAVYVPELDLVVAGAVTQQQRAGQVFALVREAVRRVRAAQEGGGG